jgi:hypothetical protein
MRALLLRRTAFLAVLVTGLALTASAVHGLTDMDRELQLAAVANPTERPTFVNDRRPAFANDHHRGPDCNFQREPARRV